MVSEQLPRTEVARLAGLSLQAFGGMPQDWDGGNPI